MPEICDTKFGKYFNLPNPGLRSYFDIVRKGQPDEYRTTFAKNDSVQKVLQDWEPFVQSLSDKWPSLVEFENDLREKVGPLSIMKPLKDRIEDIDHYYDDVTLKASFINPKALNLVIKEWDMKGKIRVRSQRRVVANMKLSTNSGSPYFTKRRNVVDKTLYSFGDLDAQFLHSPIDVSDLRDPLDYLTPSERLSLNVYKPCAVLGWRGQEGGPDDDDVKQRVVWMFPFAVNIWELQVYQPLIEAAQTQRVVPAWISMDAVDQRVTQLFDTKGDDDLIVCTDFSKFDQHFNGKLQDAAYYLLSNLLTPSGAATRWLDSVFPVKYAIPLAYDFGKIREGRHGMASGSGGTNADETLVHRALQYEVALLNKRILNPNSQCLGDDGILTYPGITVEDVVQSYTAHGLEMNSSKQYASKQDCVYLRRWHHAKYRVDGVCVGVYSTYRALGRLMEQERYYDPDTWSKEMVALRQLSIIENVKWHPLREEFAEFCMKRDKYRLGLDIPGFLKDISKIAKEATDLMPDFLGYTKSMQKNNGGINDWWIVKYLKS